MDHMLLSFDMVKYQHFEDIIYLEMLCNNFQWSLLFLFSNHIDQMKGGRGYNT